MPCLSSLAMPLKPHTGNGNQHHNEQASEGNDDLCSCHTEGCVVQAQASQALFALGLWDDVCCGIHRGQTLKAHTPRRLAISLNCGLHHDKANAFFSVVSCIYDTFCSPRKLFASQCLLHSSIPTLQDALQVGGSFSKLHAWKNSEKSCMTGAQFVKSSASSSIEQAVNMSFSFLDAAPIAEGPHRKEVVC